MHPRLTSWRLHGQTALVTGASKGIGLACARELAALGADLLLVARDGDYLEQVRDELAEECPDIQVRAFAADLAEREQRLDVFDWIADLGAPLSLAGQQRRRQPSSRRALEYSDDDCAHCSSRTCSAPST